MVANTSIVQDKIPVKIAKLGNTKDLWNKHSVLFADMADGKIKLAKKIAKLV